MELWTRSSFPLECPWRGFFVRKGPFSSSSSSFPAFYIKRAKLYFALINRWATCYTWYDPTMHDAAANYDVNNVTRARARAPLWNWIYRGPFLTLKFFSGTGREKNRAYRDFHRSLKTERSVALFFPCFLFRSLFPPRPLFPSPCNSLFARLTAIISSF